MKNNILSILLLFYTFPLIAQDIEIKDLKTLNAPGFQILDIAPNTIDKPSNPKAFAASLMSLTSSGTALPKNFALEVSPYWYFKNKNATVSQYLNIKEENRSNSYTGLFNKMSMSIASVYSDSTSGSLVKNTNYIAFGMRTNVFTYRNEKQNQKLRTALVNFSERVIKLRPNQKDTDSLEQELNATSNRIRKLYGELMAESNDSLKRAINEKYINAITRKTLIKKKLDDLENQAPDLLENNIKKDTLSQNYLKELDDLPLFQVDAAFAYSEAFPENKTENKHFNRSGVWINATLNAFSFDHEELNDNLTLMMCSRFISDNISNENTVNEFYRQKAFDFGFKIEYSIKELSLSFEYLKRDYSNDSNLNSERRVGTLQYKISENLYLTGSYGTNFGSDSTLFTLFGINYGLGKSELKSK
ncbi:hypothetical protein [Flavobacterium taihuense]|uniref:Uncharacterized protein n=1 Tax=Flavobacterium taihuense TaxID=2857508 RepID=A0ABS6XV24_9FLAO|nr:hypothetical protein [Flavobacterium taihuense]MBW4360121.1 hypothetical protein [Flavobacterium taihuense]